MNPEERRKAGERASLVGLFSNLGLFLMKLLIALFSHSMSVMADAFNNLSDSLSSAVSLLAVWISAKPADHDHPYGHGRMEYIATFSISLLILLVGFDLLKESVLRLLQPEEIQLTAWTFVLLGLSILIKLLLFLFNRHVGRKADLPVLLLSGRDALFDCLSTSLTLVALLLRSVLPFDLDAWAGILLSVLIVSSGIRLISSSATPLLGSRQDQQLVGKLTALAGSQSQVMGVHDVQLHDYGYRQAIGSMHIELDDTLSFSEAHRIADTVEQQALELFDIHLVVHADPVSLGSHLRNQLLEETQSQLAHLDPNLSVHDFQLDSSQGEPHLSFDLLLPYTYKQEDATKISQTLTRHLLSLRPGLSVSIRLDWGDTAEEGS